MASRVIALLFMAEMQPTGVLSLDPGEKDAFGDPLLHLDLPWSEWGKRSGPRFGGIVTRLAEELGAVRETKDPALYCNHGHPFGAIAMGATPGDGVCDQDGRVFGADNLYLCSGSVFPHLGANPPTLTIAALALRLGAHLEGKA